MDEDAGYREKHQNLKRKHRVMEEVRGTQECGRLRSEIEELAKVQRDLQQGNKYAPLRTLKEKLVAIMRVKDKLQKKAKLEDPEAKAEDL